MPISQPSLVSLDSPMANGRAPRPWVPRGALGWSVLALLNNLLRTTVGLRERERGITRLTLQCSSFQLGYGVRLGPPLPNNPT